MTPTEQINIILEEYRALRSEILNRQNHTFQVWVAGCAALIAVWGYLGGSLWKNLFLTLLLAVPVFVTWTIIEGATQKWENGYAS
jgi:hypothetical protein